MPTYDTPQPIDLTIDLRVGAVDIVAGDRTDTVVTVSPTDPAKALDRRGAAATTVDFDGRRLIITGPKPGLNWLGPAESVDLRVELPTGSRVSADVAVGAVRAVGRLGATRVKSSTGSVDLERTGDLWVRAAHGSTTVGAAEGDVDITAKHGHIRLGTVDGDATLRSSHGSITATECTGRLDVSLSYGDLELTRALASVAAKTGYGSIRLGEVSTGSVEVESGYGPVAIGVRAGVRARFDLSSKEGRVRNRLADAASDPSAALAVRAHARFGDVEIHPAR